jgi:hypothetical protein
MQKVNEFNKAIKLRMEGLSYSEITSIVPVSQSTLSMWLKNIELSKEHKKLLFIKQRNGQLKGALVRKRFRQEQEEIIFKESQKEISKISKRELWLLGIIAYWCEGSKQKEHNVSQGVIFANSDVILLKLFLKWLKEICLIPEEDIICSLCIHEHSDKNASMNYWSNVLDIPKAKFGNVVAKKHKINTNRKYIDTDYNGLIRISVKRSTNLNRRIKGWVLGLDKAIN